MFKKILAFIFWLFILWSIILMICFGFGIYDGMKKIEQYEQEEQKRIQKTIQVHGYKLVAFEERGKWYFVRNSKDINNRKKWIKLEVKNAI